MEIDGERFDAGVTGRDVHLCHGIVDEEWAILGPSEVVLGSELRRLLLSPSVPLPFILRLKARKKPPGDGIPLAKL